MPPMPSGPPSPSLLAALGITRLARVTGMDRAGVEVMAAVRPRGHVLQVTQGKGLTLAEAAWSAVGEAAELDAAERIDGAPLRFCRGEELEGLVLDDDGLARAWLPGERLLDGEAVWVAAERVYCPPAGARWLGPSTTSWTSNGYGAHVVRAAAVEHAVLELWERHALAAALPRGWSPPVVAAARIVWRTPLVTRLEAHGFGVVPCVLAERPVPLAGVLLFDSEDPAVPLTAGYACRRTAGAALEAALLEAAQSRLTEIHGAREDIATGKRPAGEALLAAARSGAGRPLARSGAVRGWPRALAARVVVVPVTASPLHVVKAIGVGLEESELLR
ncbi:MAG: YcaO-like family protein [Myxococcaceae bacterium]|nr:YcaO-like family protein [Myxococcaceae bacterium]